VHDIMQQHISFPLHAHYEQGVVKFQRAIPRSVIGQGGVCFRVVSNPQFKHSTF
jgi:hypothetical protein